MHSPLKSAAPESLRQSAGIPALEARGLSFRYPTGPVGLEQVSLRVEPGEKVVILGATGSGKSTLLRLLNGLDFADTGRLLAFGEEITPRRLADPEFSRWFRRRVGFVFQNSDAQLFSPTVRDELAFGPLQLGLEPDAIEARIRDTAALLGIGGLLERPPFQLSTGEKKKAAIACVLTINPSVLLLDEPTAGLDPRSRASIVELLTGLSRAGKTLVTATHDLDIVPDLADRVLILDESHAVAAEGAPSELLRDHALLHRANLIHAHLHWHGEMAHSHPHHHGGDHDHSHEP